MIYLYSDCDRVDLEEVARHMGDMNLISLKYGDYLNHHELISKLNILGVGKKEVSKLIAPWQDQKLKPDFILFSKIFRKGNNNFYNIMIFSNQMKRNICDYNL